jgi:hypothetical protein
MSDSKPPEDRDQKEQVEWYERTLYQVLLWVGGIALFVIVGALVLDWYIDPQTSTQKKDLVQALGLITAGVAGAVGIFFTWRGQRLAREAQEDNQKNTLTQLDNAQEELRLTRQGQITERFTRAIDQLGARDVQREKNLEMRFGGIYALERIAKESPEDYWPVMEILTAYVREHAPRGSRAEDQPPTPDIQAILTVLGRRIPNSEHDEIGRIALRATDLIALRATDLQRADLQEANLQGVDLQEANLDGAHLQGAKVTDEQLADALSLQGAIMPDGQKYEDRLKDEEGSGKDVEIE